MYETIYLLAEVLIWVLCPLLIGLILLQGGAGDISSAFGGGGQLDSTLGVGASRKMAKVTGWLGLIFMAMVLFLAIRYKGAITDKPGATVTEIPIEMPQAPAGPMATEASVPSLVTVESSAPTLVPPASAAEAIPSTTAAAVVSMEAAPSASTATGG